ncbi:4-hydroxy-3-methylbut-2-enyl diphosphate reductase [Alkalithermobacter thermoalcaliphilus JW-YL-7 = DSM 7308]|uniref:4-hydroxy-3-methylbut-2-enyl diphosphate reductase n=1 Tax=Alkalithermobacter thermoalcaliphilus JW-YL-7 = DSM 7308 TaxID=1121328 RepID=A0A150FRN9_CLOPD|nr:4-hydroxy-3-methylbut-2-enyl diphosphate reductase [[Clostridium] paradoxum JW-YL-7 = DSM 7308]SHK79157.1 4-hydroxy-3-methylbut-2-enyl diphosphate reductase [[Clostridium] paradoxum JW-YL-7 = DSM 7308]
MEIKIAKYAGFCFGVERAMNMAWECLKKNSNIYSLGPLIHNEQAVKKYEQAGLKIIENLEQVSTGDTVIIRSHGVPIDIYDKAKERGLDIIDLTCPYVKKIQNIAKRYYDKGYKIVIIGDPDHPEVIGINGWCNNEAIVIKKLEDLNKISRNISYCIVAQTTMNLKVYNEICESLKEITDNAIFYNTICSATKERQESAINTAKEVDVMIVIGGMHSSNTQKLVQVCKQFCKTYHIETIDDLNIDEIRNYKSIGITAGASTPDWIINEVVENIRDYFNK